MSKPKLLSIVGFTATGKTALALQLAEDVNTDFAEEFTGVNLISADSRQVYQGMRIGTGVDLPERTAQKSASTFPFPFFEIDDQTLLHGVEIIKPTAAWSLQHFRNIAGQIITQSQTDKALPMIVGGTGLYQLQELAEIKKKSNKMSPPNEEVRERAQAMELAELQNWAKDVAAADFENMNHSDQNNPRRLVRLIERATANEVAGLEEESGAVEKGENLNLNDFEKLTIGLQAPIEWIEEKVAERVKKRLENGMIEEVQKLMIEYGDETWKMPAFTATGYKEVRAFLSDQMSKDEMEKQWIQRERQYAKRQATWWRARPGVTWFDVTTDNWRPAARALLHSFLTSPQ